MPPAWTLTAVLIFIHGLVLGLTTFALFGDAHRSIVDVLEKWQTLIAGIIALGAAWLTVWVLKQQIAIQKEQLESDQQRHLDIQARKSWMAKAHMPDALSALCRYTEQCTEYLGSGSTGALPDAPTEAITTIKNGIEYVDTQSIPSLFELVRRYQIHNARLSDRTGMGHPHRSTERMYDVAYLRALVDRLFSYARNEAPTAPNTRITRGGMIAALRACVGIEEFYIDEAKHQPVIEMIKRRHSE